MRQNALWDIQLVDNALEILTELWTPYCACGAHLQWVCGGDISELEEGASGGVHRRGGEADRLAVTGSH